MIIFFFCVVAISILQLLDKTDVAYRSKGIYKESLYSLLVIVCSFLLFVA